MAMRCVIANRALGQSMFSGGNARLPRAVQMSAQANASSVSKNDLIKIVATKAGVSQETTRSVLESLTDTIMNAVAKDQKVGIVGFGTFERNVRAARIGRNPATGAELQIPEKAVPTFKSGKIFKDTVEKSYTPTP